MKSLELIKVICLAVIALGIALMALEKMRINHARNEIPEGALIRGRGTSGYYVSHNEFGITMKHTLRGPPRRNFLAVVPWDHVTFIGVETQALDANKGEQISGADGSQ